MRYQQKSWFSIALAMWLVLILSFTGLYLLEYMIPFSKNIKWVENASQAFYESYSGIEESLLLVYSWSIWDDYLRLHTGDEGFAYSVSSSGTSIPLAGKWNSDYDTDWNQLSLQQPISLFVWRNRLSSGWADRIELRLRIPDLDRISATPEDLKWVNEDFVIWQLSSQRDSLTVASWSLIAENNIDGSDIRLWQETWSPLRWADQNFSAFYNDQCDDVDEECILKISIINPLVDGSNDAVIPYLEYQIGTDTTIPFTHSFIVSEGKSLWFTKTLQYNAPINATSSAFDFTVLQ